MRTWLTDCLTFDSSGTSVRVQRDDAAGKIQPKQSLERFAIARQRGANAFDERQHLRVGVQIHHAPAVRAFDGQYSAAEHQRLGVRLERALFEPIRRVVAQFTGGFDRTAQDGKKVLFDELDSAMLAHRQHVP